MKNLIIVILLFFHTNSFAQAIVKHISWTYPTNKIELIKFYLLSSSDSNLPLSQWFVSELNTTNLIVCLDESKTNYILTKQIVSD